MYKRQLDLVRVHVQVEAAAIAGINGGILRLVGVVYHAILAVLDVGMYFDIVVPVSYTHLLLAGLLCALCFSGLFAMERKGGMDEILACTPLGLSLIHIWKFGLRRIYMECSSILRAILRSRVYFPICCTDY